MLYNVLSAYLIPIIQLAREIRTNCLEIDQDYLFYIKIICQFINELSNIFQIPPVARRNHLYETPPLPRVRWISYIQGFPPLSFIS